MLDPTKPAHARAISRLGSEPVAWLTTVRPNGQPQSSPIWFTWDGSEFLIFSLADTARVTNIAGNPRVSLNLDSDLGSDVVSIEGVARIEPDGAPSTEVPEYQEKYRDAIPSIGHTPESFARRYPVRIVVTPARARAS